MYRSDKEYTQRSRRKILFPCQAKYPGIDNAIKAKVRLLSPSKVCYNMFNCKKQNQTPSTDIRPSKQVIPLPDPEAGVV